MKASLLFIVVSLGITTGGTVVMPTHHQLAARLSPESGLWIKYWIAVRTLWIYSPGKGSTKTLGIYWWDGFRFSSSTSPRSSPLNEAGSMCLACQIQLHPRRRPRRWDIILRDVAAGVPSSSTKTVAGEPSFSDVPAGVPIVYIIVYSGTHSPVKDRCPETFLTALAIVLPRSQTVMDWMPTSCILSIYLFINFTGVYY